MTEDQFKKLLAEALAEQTKQLDQKIAESFGKQTRYLGQRIDVLEAHVGERLNQLKSTLDGVAKRLEIDADEQTIVNSRNERRIGQLADNTGTKLVPEQ